jgi:hypothetical protein
MSQHKQALLRRNGVIHIDLRAVQVARERIRNVARNHGDSITALQVLLHASGIFGERDHREIVNVWQEKLTAETRRKDRGIR